MLFEMTRTRGLFTCMSTLLRPASLSETKICLEENAISALLFAIPFWCHLVPVSSCVNRELVPRCGICRSITLYDEIYDKQWDFWTPVFADSALLCWKDGLGWLSRLHFANHVLQLHIVFHHARLEVRVYATFLSLTFGTPLLVMLLYRYSSTFRKWYLVWQRRRVRGFKGMKPAT